MNEEIWLICNKPAVLMRCLRSRSGSRRRRFMLFNCACCRRIWHILVNGSQKFIETVERNCDADSPPRHSSVWEWEQKARYDAFDAPSRHPDTRVRIAAALAAASIKQENHTTAEEVAIAVSRLAPVAERLARKATEQSAQSALLRDIFGNPFRGITICTTWLSWNGGIVRRLAQVAYETRSLPAGTLDNTRLAILADALEEAGCTDEQILMHLRSGKEHYRGCFVLDALLGKG